MRTTSYIQIKNYFENLVNQHTELNGFAGYFNRELLIKMASSDGLPSPYLALYRYELGLNGREQNSTGIRQIAFAIMFNKVDVNNFEAQYDAIDQAEALALQIFARIQFDNNNKNHMLFNSLEKDSIRILPVELSAESYGVECPFNIKNKISLSLDPILWNDIDRVCQ